MRKGSRVKAIKNIYKNQDSRTAMGVNMCTCYNIIYYKESVHCRHKGKNILPILTLKGMVTTTSQYYQNGLVVIARQGEMEQRNK